MIFRFLVIFKRSGLRKQKSRWKRTRGCAPYHLFYLPLAWYRLTRNIFAPGDFLSLSLLLFPDSQRLIFFFWLLSFFFFLYVVFLLSGHFLSLSKTSTMSVNFLCAVLHTMRGFIYDVNKSMKWMGYRRVTYQSMKKWSPVLDEAARPISTNVIKTVGPSSCNSISSCSDEDECRDMVFILIYFRAANSRNRNRK